MRPLCWRRAARVANSSRVRVQSHGEIHGEKFSAKFTASRDGETRRKINYSKFWKGWRNRCGTRKWPLADLWFWEAYNDLFLQHNNLISSIQNKPLQSWRKIRRCLTCQYGSQYEEISLSDSQLTNKYTVHRLNTATQPSPVPPPDPRPPSHALVSRVEVVKAQEDLHWWWSGRRSRRSGRLLQTLEAELQSRVIPTWF